MKNPLLPLLFLASSAAAQSFTVPLPGTLVRATAATGPDGRPGVALLVAARPDRKGEKTLLFLDPERRAVVRLAGGLHEEVNTLTGFDLAGNGAVAPIAGMPGVLFTPGGGSARKVLDQPDLDLRSVSGATAGRPWLAAARAGLLELLAAAPGGGLVRQQSFPLPVKAQRLRWGLRLTSPPVAVLPGDPALFAVGPEPVGRRRLKTLLIPAGGGETFESWSLLPMDERLMSDRRYLRLDGEPVLAATTFEKIGLLARKRFRLFVLKQDRSRKGTAPTLAVETDCPIWYPLDAVAADADGDGRQDLVIAHPGGLRGRETIVWAYRGLGGGRLAPNPRRWKLNDEASDWLYGPDLTADGVPDFLVYVKDRLLLYAGDPKGGRPLAGKPVWAVKVPGAPTKTGKEGNDEEGPGEEAPGPDRERLVQAFDLPGGGRVVFAQGFQKDGKSVLTVVSRK
ncbi:MAG TPA: hypothetical protein VKK31_11560 [Thermoanaerobaculia bacterium]|nr:hypothetical protein [Thermoanaerobaculia bacterium]